MSGWSIAATIAFAAFGLISLVALPVFLREERELSKKGVRVRGRVVERLDHGGDGFHGAVEYVVDGVTRRLVSEQTGYDVGEEVVVIYLPERPGQARIDSKRELWGNTIGAVVAIVLFFVAALVSSGLGWFGVF